MKILDACCGSRMFWFDKQQKDTIYQDNRTLQTTLCDGRALSVNPDIIGDFRNMEFADNSFNLVVFDPPHLKQAGKNSWLAKKYGVLDKERWQEDLCLGFKECMRVLKEDGVLLFKWSEDQIKTRDVIKCFGQKPVLGDKKGKKRWLVFVKE